MRPRPRTTVTNPAGLEASSRPVPPCGLFAGVSCTSTTVPTCSLASPMTWLSGRCGARRKHTGQDAALKGSSRAELHLHRGTDILVLKNKSAMRWVKPFSPVYDARDPAPQGPGESLACIQSMACCQSWLLQPPLAVWMDLILSILSARKRPSRSPRLGEAACLECWLKW